MRRARIKATAVVPVRRKAAAAAASNEPPKEASAPEPDKPAEADVKPVETTSAPVEPKQEVLVEATKSPEKVAASPAKPQQSVAHVVVSPEKQNVSTERVAVSPVKEKKSLEKVAVSPVKAKESTKSVAVSPVKAKESTESVAVSFAKQDVKESKLSDTSSDTTAKNDVQFSRSLESPPRADTAIRVESARKLKSPTKAEKSSVSCVEGSPTKSLQSRSCFTRPSPRLDGGGRVRRNSVQGSGASASESEDDSRRSTSIAPSRVRNDSVCSVQSLKDSSNTSSVATKLNLGQKRKIVVSESSRKLSEARREFNLKHENKTPTHDKSVLTMYDLIYYNPATNPMKPKPVNRNPPARKLSVCSVVEKEKEEEEANADDPSEMPVPQVKVGPNGELIIDEKSLVIDQYKVQENIDRANVIIDDDNTGNGFYKKRQKSKDWNKWETVKFYKALNTYGTDFLLMQSTFPNRTRIELKLKYKKEERINPKLIEKALQYQEFDTEALEKDLANVEENQRKEIESKRKGKKDTTLTKRRRRRCKLVSDEITGDTQNENSENNSGDNQSSDEDVRITITAKKVRKRRRKKTKSSEKSDKDDSESNLEVYSAKPTRSGRATKRPKRAQKSIKVYDVQEKKKPRGRPKKQKTTAVDEEENMNVNTLIEINDSQNATAVDEEKNMNVNTLIEINDTENTQPNDSNTLNVEESNKTFDKDDNTAESDKVSNSETNEKMVVESAGQNEKESDSSKISTENSTALSEISDDIPNMSNLKPGSLVVLKKDSEDEPGKTVLQVYVVSDDYDASNPNYKDSLLPIDMSPEELQTVTNCIKNIEPQNIS